MLPNEAPGTPFLDRQAPLPPRNTSVPAILGWFSTIGAIAVVLALGFVPALRGDRLIEWLLDPAAVFEVWMTGFFFYLVTVVVHEVGHVAGGLLGGFTFQHVRLGMLVIERPGRLSIRPDLSLFLTGETRMAPPAAGDARWRYAVMVFGGPAANVLSALLAIALSGGAFGLFAGIALFFAIVELLPVETPLGLSDGLRLRMLFFERARSDRWLAIFRLLAESSDATYPDKLSPQLIATATAVRDPSRDTISAYALAYSAAMSQQAFVQAGEGLDTCLRYAAYAAPDVREALASDAAVYQAAVRQNPELARQWLAEISPKARPWLRLRCEVAILELTGDLVGAWRTLDRFEQTLVSSGREPQILAFVRRWKVGLQNLMPITTPPQNPPASA